MEHKTKLHEFDLNGIKVLLQDLSTSGTLDVVKDDIKNNAYGINDIKESCFDTSNVIIDLGAHVGMISIYLSKKYPKAQIIAVEPFPLNWTNLEANIALNGCNNIQVVKKGITKDSRMIDLGCTRVNTGGAIYLYGLGKPYIETVTLSDLLEPYEKVSFLKMDVEGFEFEICPNFNEWGKIHNAGIEIHNKMADLGGNLAEITELKEYLHTRPVTGFMWTPPMEAFQPVH